MMLAILSGIPTLSSSLALCKYSDMVKLADTLDHNSCNHADLLSQEQVNPLLNYADAHN